jgi:hypothetical protein
MACMVRIPEFALSHHLFWLRAPCSPLARSVLAEHADKRVPTVLARACIGETITGCWRQSKCIIEFAIRRFVGANA